MLSLLAILGLGACELQELVSDERDTLVTDVRVLGVVARSPEVPSGEPLRLRPYVANPRGVELDVMIWSCVPDEDGVCLFFWEGLRPLVIEQWQPLLEGAEDDDQDGEWHELAVEEIDEQLLVLVTEVRLPFFVLACEHLTCPVIQQAASVNPPWADIIPLLSDPEALMRQLPAEGVHLAGRSVVVSNRLRGVNDNPSLQPIPRREGGCDFPNTVSTGNVARICLESRDPQGGPLAAYPFTLAGGLTPGEGRVRERRVEFEYRAPASLPAANPVKVWFVAEEGDGAGSTVLSEEITIVP